MPVHAAADTTEPLKTLAVHLRRGIYMHKLSDDERNLLRHYAEDERVVSGVQRSPTPSGHRLYSGAVDERARRADCRDDAGRKALRETS